MRPTSRRPLLAIAAVLLPFPAAAASLDVDLLWQLQRVSQPAASPDGRWIAFTVTTYDADTNASDADVWVVAADGSVAARRLTTAQTSESAPFWSPDSRRVGHLVKADKAQRLGVVNLHGGEPQPLLDVGVPIRAARWARNGRIVFEAATWPDLGARFEAVKKRADELEADKTKARISESRLLRYWDSYRTDGSVPHLFELDPATGRVRDLLPGFTQLTGFEGFEWDLAPDGSEVVFSANRTANPHRELDFDLFVVDVATANMTNLTANNRGPDTKPVYAPDSRSIAFQRGDRPNGPSEVLKLGVIERRDARIVHVGTELDAQATTWRWSQDGTTLFFAAERQGRVNLYGARPGERAHELARGGTVDGIAPVAAGVAFVRHDLDHPAELFVLGSTRTGPRPLTAINGARLADVRLGRVESIRYAGHGGDPVAAWLVHPPGRSGSRRAPAVLMAHGGPFSAFNDAFSYRWNPHVWAARGYVVLMPNFHGSTGYGQPFADAILGNHGEKPAADMLAALDVLAQRDDVDPKRIAIAGGSYGGYLAALLPGLTDRFAASIVHAGVFDLSAQFASDSHWDRPESYGNAPWTDPVELDRWSPSRLAPKLSTPTLVLHGEKDYRVPVTQGINLHGVLTGKGVASRIVVFPDENHWILKPQASRIWHREAFAWLARWMPEASVR